MYTYPLYIMEETSLLFKIKELGDGRKAGRQGGNWSCVANLRARWEDLCGLTQLGEDV